MSGLISDDKPIDIAQAGDDVLVMLNQTVFYGESGGQVGDKGIISWPDGQAKVTDTQKTAGMFIHHAQIISGSLGLDQPVSLMIDDERRDALRAHHSATHLLHEALRQVLGEHVAQKGSLVEPTRLRFDFSHPNALSDDEISAVETIVNSRIRMNSEVSTRIMTPDEAVGQGALALFGEKYGDEVRVVTMGGKADTAERSAWSVELCGGTHVAQTGDIALLKIISESAVAGGVRRIEAVTHISGLEWLSAKEKQLNKTANLLKSSAEQVADRVGQLLDDKRMLERELATLRQKLAVSAPADNAAEQIGNIHFIGRVLSDIPAKELKSTADAMRKQASGSVICLVALNDGKASVLVCVTDDLNQQISAVDLVKIGAEMLGGKGGGGRADMAQAGGPEGGNAQAAIEAIKQHLATL